MLRAWMVTEQGLDVIDDPDAISDALERPCLVWVDLVDPDQGELETLSREFDLHALWINDVREAGQRPKLEVYKTHAFVVGYAHDEDPTDLPEVAILFSARWLLTVRQRNRAGRCFEIDDVAELYDRMRGGRMDVGLLLYALLVDMVDGYFDTVDAAEDQISAIEETVFLQQPPDQRVLQQELVRVRRGLIVLRRHVAPMRDVVLALMRREVAWLDAESVVYLQDVLDRLLRVIDGIDVQRELLSSVVDAQLSLQGNRLNTVMKKMTSWGAILIVATLISGIYGMNFRNMPELEWEYGYFAALSSMFVVTFALYLWFRHKDWL